MLILDIQNFHNILDDIILVFFQSILNKNFTKNVITPTIYKCIIVSSSNTPKNIPHIPVYSHVGFFIDGKLLYNLTGALTITS